MQRQRCTETATANSYGETAMEWWKPDITLFYTVSQKTKQICFCQNLGKFPLILIIFDS